MLCGHTLAANVQYTKSNVPWDSHNGPCADDDRWKAQHSEWDMASVAQGAYGLLERIGSEDMNL